MASLQLVTAPTVGPLTLTQVKAHLRIESGVTDDDAYITSLMAVARAHCEAITNRQVSGPATWLLQLDHWPGNPFRPDRYPWSHHVIEIPRPPMVSLTSINYMDPGGNIDLWDPSNYVIDQPIGELAGRTRISLAYTKYWPVIMPQADVVQVEFVAGYPTVTDEEDPPETTAVIPPPLVQGMLIAIADWYENRDEGTQEPVRARRLWLPYVSRPTTRQMG